MMREHNKKRPSIIYRFRINMKTAVKWARLLLSKRILISSQMNLLSVNER